MKLDKRGNVYTIIYVAIVVLVVGTALAFTSLSLRERQDANVASDKMRQILASARLSGGDDVIATYKSHIVATPVYDMSGKQVGDNAFDIDMKDEYKVDETKRRLPVYECRVDDGSIKYIIPLYGAGLWGPVWGYVSVDADGSTVYGAYFDHQGETPGLGAEIAKPEFSNQFEGKQLFKNDRLMPVTVVKKGQKPLGDEDYVDGISGGTITSKGVASMLDNCLRPYGTVLKELSKNNGNGIKEQ